jgi:hypothetical protein
MDPKLQPWTPSYAPRRGRVQRRRINWRTVGLYLATVVCVVYLIAMWWVGRSGS